MIYKIKKCSTLNGFKMSFDITEKEAHEYAIGIKKVILELKIKAASTNQNKEKVVEI